MNDTYSSKKSMNKAAVFLVTWALTLSSGEWKAQQEMNGAYLPENTAPVVVKTKNKAETVLNAKEEEKMVSREQIRAMLEEMLQKHPEIYLSKEEGEKFTELLQNETLLSSLYEIMKKERIWSLYSILLSLLSGALYGWAYFATLQKIRKEWLEINPTTFAVFAGTSGMMVGLNGAIPGSIVYAESFLLASACVFFHMRNKKNGVSHKSSDFEIFSQHVPMPVVHYDKSNYPVIWNKKMEEETGYNHQEVINYHNEIVTHPDWTEGKRGEIMTMLYKWRNLERVLDFLERLKKTGEWYYNITFTMNTKSWEEKTFQWSTFPDGKGGTMRTAKHLTDSNEIREELEKTKELLRKDALTGALNRRALDEDLQNMFLHHNRQSDSEKIMVMVDVDNFKKINDLQGHEMGDVILKKFVAFLQKKLRPEDRIYRYGGDEFILIIESSYIDVVAHKINTLRHEFFSDLSEGEKTIINPVGTSWWVFPFHVSFSESREDLSAEEIAKKIYAQADSYMYAVKYYHLIEKDLMEKNKIRAVGSKKNGVASPVYGATGDILGIQVMTEYGWFTLSMTELETIEKLKSASKH